MPIVDLSFLVGFCETFSIYLKTNAGENEKVYVPKIKDRVYIVLKRKYNLRTKTI